MTNKNEIYINNPSRRIDWLPESCGVYTVFFNDGVKIGMSKKGLKKRIHQYFFPWNKPVYAIFIKETEQYKRAEQIALEECSKAYDRPNYHNGNGEYFMGTNLNFTTDIVEIVRAAVISAEKEYDYQINALKLEKPVSGKWSLTLADQK